MSDNKYFLLLLQQGRSFKPIEEKLKDIDAFFTGIGYAVHQKNESLLRQLVKSLPNVQILAMPLPQDQSFESYRLSHKASFFQELLLKLEGELLSLKKSLHLEDIDEEAVAISTHLLDNQKAEFINLLHKKDKLQKQIEWAKGMEEALNSQKTHKISIKPIIDQDINYLLEDAPDMPRLVNFIDGANPKPFIRKGIVAQIVGAGGVGKTHVLAQLALSITTGANWLGIYPIEKAGHVFIGLGENKDDDIHRLMRKIVKGYEKNNHETTLFAPNPLQEASKRLFVMSFTAMNGTFIRDGQPTPFFEAFFQELKDKEPKEGWACIILDPISRFMGADAENDNAAATQFIALLERLTLELKGQPTVIFGHHMNKSGVSSTNTDQGAARGSSAITDGVRWQANLEKVKKTSNPEGEDQYELNQISMRPVKSNFTVVLPSQKLQKDDFGCLCAIKNEVYETPRTVSTNRSQKVGK